VAEVAAAVGDVVAEATVAVVVTVVVADVAVVPKQKLRRLLRKRNSSEIVLLSVLQNASPSSPFV